MRLAVAENHWLAREAGRTKDSGARKWMQWERENEKSKRRKRTNYHELPVAAPSTLVVELTGTEKDENIDGKGKEGEDGEEREWETCLGKGKDDDAARNYRRPP